MNAFRTPRQSNFPNFLNENAVCRGPDCPQSNDRIASLKRLAMVRPFATRRMSMRRILLPFSLLAAFVLPACATTAEDAAPAAAAPARSAAAPVAQLVRQVDIRSEERRVG